ncbi:surface layer protein [Streptomyces cinnamoneus]|uniref:Surface layer protein n=1 Tax=Streptomyces cinnamoneus TaxID=53446 RepID=A0A2G1XLN1_STRCJ|nr:surface layer protein [Streptomyces cinnamoneus]PHQ52126.1 surface layer protein [Streptomyces cinnamoneus]PPT16206.1 surface layer protein [Streptomyces cinnamoneus]
MNSTDVNSSAIPARSGDVLAVVSQSGPTVTFFDALTHERLDVLEVPAQPHELLFDADRRLIYCTSAYVSGYYGANQGTARQVSVIDADARKIIDVLDTAPDHAPHGIALDRARDRLYVSVEATATAPGGVIVYDARTRERIGRIPVMADGPHWFAVTPDGRRGYSTNKEAPFVSVLDLERDEFAGRIEVPGSEGLDVSRDGAHVYVAAPHADFGAGPAARPGIRVIETATGEVVRTLPTEGMVFPVHTTATGAVLAGELRMAGAGGGVLGRQTDGVLTVFSPGTLEPAGHVQVGVFPLTITSSPDGKVGYVANVVSSTVTVVDLERLAVLTTLEVDRLGEPGAHGLAYIPAAHA